jgi:hypothetical protein
VLQVSPPQHPKQVKTATQSIHPLSQLPQPPPPEGPQSRKWDGSAPESPPNQPSLQEHLKTHPQPQQFPLRQRQQQASRSLLHNPHPCKRQHRHHSRQHHSSVLLLLQQLMLKPQPQLMLALASQVLR